MSEADLVELDRELVKFISPLISGLGRVERCEALGWYACGLLLAGGRKSIAPMAARLCPEPSEADAMRQRLQQAVVVARWNEHEVSRRLRQRMEQEMSELGGLEADVCDDTGLPKRGPHSVGVARQYSGTLGRVEQCQVVVSLHSAGPLGSYCHGMRLYLPEPWAQDWQRRAQVGVPESIAFATKWQLVLDLLDRATAEGKPKRPLVADAGYGDVAQFRRELNQRQIPYVVEVMSTTAVWAPGTGPEPPPTAPTGARGRPRTVYRDGEHRPLSVTELVLSQTPEALQTVSWQNLGAPERHSRFGALRVQPAAGHCQGQPPEPEQWLLWEWPEGQELPEHYWLSTVPQDTPLERLVYLTKLRWRVERDYQELKEEVGLDHYEGRTWAGLHHHLVLCTVAHSFLMLQRAKWHRAAESAAPSATKSQPSQRKKRPATLETATV
ncbi:MAG TPA: IS701 family transposase [Burkholderiaceae bacterium]|nr:IS701 family transposase [Burkholderiaceae bacterium]